MCTFKNYRGRVPSNSDGAAYIEFAVVVPFIIFLIVAILEYGRYLTTYQKVAQLTHEGIRYALAIPGVELGTSCFSGGVVTDCAGNTVSYPVQNSVYQRVNALLQLDPVHIEPGYLLKFQRVAGTSPVGTDKLVIFTISARHQPIVFPVGFTMFQEARAGYLF